MHIRPRLATKFFAMLCLGTACILTDKTCISGTWACIWMDRACDCGGFCLPLGGGRNDAKAPHRCGKSNVDVGCPCCGLFDAASARQGTAYER
ncbi:hypothetical protein EDB81DRAFT_787774 [Dactylonectria macrodidyma]|uniref:Secreted protein n=1 Tax=Dactylonectria macrodidyma TaxID=307937 RepID=A0A9P9JAE3_9HYPO|nr:hypothetical protein EDB81DRAFT_787774 [Dactylonectria macrodidyma]